MKDIAIVVLVIVFIALLVLSLSPKSYYSHSHPMLDKVRENFKKLDPRYGDIPLRYGDSAYTENKQLITLCLADPDTKQYYDMNTIMYVALHELAHMLSKTHGHNEEFKRNFSKLLQEATNKGIYDPNKPIPPSYCGVGPDTPEEE